MAEAVGLEPTQDCSWTA